MFVRNSNRFEVAVLAAPKDAKAKDAEIALRNKVSALADQLTRSLQQCKVKNKSGDSPSKP